MCENNDYGINVENILDLQIKRTNIYGLVQGLYILNVFGGHCVPMHYYLDKTFWTTHFVIIGLNSNVQVELNNVLLYLCNSFLLIKN